MCGCYRFKSVDNPIISGCLGWILNDKGNVVAVVKLSGKIIKE